MYEFINKIFIPREIRAEHLPESLQFIDSQRFNDTIELDKQRPIFILSAGWRSGSTLLQRLINSDGSVLIWGEPFGDFLPVPRLAGIVASFKKDDNHFLWSYDKFSRNFVDNPLVAVLNSGTSALYEAHRSFHEKLLYEPVKKLGFQNWGAKWVRLSAYYGYYFKWLFPNCRIIMITRHPLKAYKSYKYRDWYTIRPIHQMTNVFKFMAHWNYLASSFFKYHKQLGALLIKYEDLINKKEILDKIDDFLSIKIDRTVLNQKIGSTENKPKTYFWQILVSRIMAGTTLKRLGY
jgi:hypothetical protein